MKDNFEIETRLKLSELHTKISNLQDSNLFLSTAFLVLLMLLMFY